MKFEYINGFQPQKFELYLVQNYPTDTQGREMYRNIVNYGLKHCNTSKDQLASFLANMIPDISLEEVSQFCSEEILTDSTIKNVEEAKTPYTDEEYIAAICIVENILDEEELLLDIDIDATGDLAFFIRDLQNDGDYLDNNGLFDLEQVKMIAASEKVDDYDLNIIHFLQSNYVAELLTCITPKIYKRYCFQGIDDNVFDVLFTAEKAEKEKING